MIGAWVAHVRRLLRLDNGRTAEPKRATGPEDAS
jgi:hypothetical protein